MSPPFLAHPIIQTGLGDGGPESASPLLGFFWDLGLEGFGVSGFRAAKFSGPTLDPTTP